MVDALDSKSSSGNRVRVRFPPRVLKRSDYQIVRPFLIENKRENTVIDIQFYLIFQAYKGQFKTGNYLIRFRAVRGV